MSSSIRALTEEQLEERKRRHLMGLRAVFLEEWRRELERRGMIESEPATPHAGPASS